MRWRRHRPVTIETDRFRLTSATRAEIARRTYEWTFDPEVMTPLNQAHGTWSRRNWYKHFHRFDDRTRFCFLIQEKATGALIGYELGEISKHDAVALTVVIGDRSWWGRGVVLETRTALLDFYFGAKQCVRAWGSPNARNFPSIFNYQRLGFRHEGTLRSQVALADGSGRADTLLFGILREEWLARRGQR